MKRRFARFIVLVIIFYVNLNRQFLLHKFLYTLNLILAAHRNLVLISASLDLY